MQSLIKTADGRKIGVTRISNMHLRAFNDVPDPVKVTYFNLLSYAYGNKMWCNPSIPRQANDRGTTPKTIMEHLKFLEDKAKLIKVKRKPGVRNMYILIDPGQFKYEILTCFDKEKRNKKSDNGKDHKKMISDLMEKFNVKKEDL